MADLQLILQQLEQAAEFVLAPPSVSDPQQRHSAEEVFLSFRKSKLPYNVCRYLFEHSKNNYVLFQAATTVKECVVREWSLLSGEDIASLRSFMLHYVTGNPSLQSYVREQILSAVAVIVKRGTLDNKGGDRSSVFADVTQLISSGDLTMQMLACSILMSLLNEFASTGTSSSLGLTWEFHYKCKRTFEATDLKQVFLFCLQVLGECEAAPAPQSREVELVFNRFLAITAQVLNWRFTGVYVRRHVGSFSSVENVSLKPAIAWRDTVLDRALLQLFFKIHRKVRHSSEMQHHCLQCLSQLASLNGDIFEDDDARQIYLQNFTEEFLHLINSIEVSESEALGVSNVLATLTTFFSPLLFSKLPKQTQTVFFETLTKLTCNFGKEAALEEAMHKDDCKYLEAYEHCLQAWLGFLLEPSHFPPEQYKEHYMHMFNSYLQCHLAAPDGTRNQRLDGDASTDDEEIDEMEEDDREKFKDQLKSVGMIGRQVLSHSLTLMSKLLEDRVTRLYNQLNRIAQTGDGLDTDSSVLDSLNEDIHWLLLLTTSLLTDENVGETPMIPTEIMDYSISQTQNVDISTTLQVLASPGEKAEDIPGSAQKTDHVVRLISAVFRLCEVENRATQASLTAHLSPQVGRSMMYFFIRWVQGYLLPCEKYYQQISLALTAAFGQDTDGGRWTVSYLLHKIWSNLTVWSAETELSEDTTQLLVTLVEKRDKRDYVIKCEHLWLLAKNHARHEPPLNLLASSVKRHLVKGLVLVGFSADANIKDEYWKYVLHAVHERFHAVLTQPNFSKVCHDPGVKLEVESLLESACGIAEASGCANVTLLFNCLHPILIESVKLLDIFHNYEEIVQLVLDLFSTTVDKQICYLKEHESQKLLECCLSCIQTYAKHNLGKMGNAADAEEEQFSDLLVMMQLLLNMLSKDFLDFALDDDEVNSSSSEISACDVVLYGLDILIPLMNEELLKFPSLCMMYFKLVTIIAEVFPEKLIALPENLLKTLLASVEMGLTDYGSDVTRQCLEMLDSVASYVFQNPNTHSMAYEAMAHFLEVLFKLLLLESTFDLDLLDIASQTFFALVCCHQEKYKHLVETLLAKQTDATYHHRLADAFTQLTPATFKMALDRRSKIAFRTNFDTFIMNVRGFLCMR